MRTTVSLIMLLCCTTVSNGAGEKLLQGTAHYVKSSRHFLWQTQIGESRVFLCGSVHRGKAEHYPRPEPYMRALRQSDKVVFEVKDDYASVQTAVLDYAKQFPLPDDLPLSRQLTEKDLNLVRRIVGDELFKVLDRCQASHTMWYVAGGALALKGYEGKYGVDFQFKDIAIREGKEVLGLETLEEEFEALRLSLPPGEQIASLKLVLANIDVLLKVQLSMLERYFDNDVAGFRRATKVLYSAHKAGPLFRDRNRRWVKRLVAMATKESATYFVVVGAGHFFGPDNLFGMLEAKGYTIEPVVQVE